MRRRSAIASTGSNFANLRSTAITNSHGQNHAVEFVETSVVQIKQHGGHAKAKQPKRSGISSGVFDLSNRFVHGASVLRKSSITQSQYRLAGISEGGYNLTRAELHLARTGFACGRNRRLE